MSKSYRIRTTPGQENNGFIIKLKLWDVVHVKNQIRQQ